MSCLRRAAAAAASPAAHPSGASRSAGPDGADAAAAPAEVCRKLSACAGCARHVGARMLVLPSGATSDDHHYDGSGVRLDVGDDAGDIGTGADGGSSLMNGLLAASAFEQGELLALGRTELATSEDRRRWAASRASGGWPRGPPPGRGAKQLAALPR